MFLTAWTFELPYISFPCFILHLLLSHSRYHIRYSLFIIHYLLFIIHYSSFIIHDSSLSIQINLFEQLVKTFRWTLTKTVIILFVGFKSKHDLLWCMIEMSFLIISNPFLDTPKTDRWFMHKSLFISSPVIHTKIAFRVPISDRTIRYMGINKFTICLYRYQSLNKCLFLFFIYELLLYNSTYFDLQSLSWFALSMT
jgi:hypothetical protein